MRRMPPACPKASSNWSPATPPKSPQEFLENPLCRKITFTGSTEVGKTSIRGAASQVKPLSLELGGLAPVLVFDDADLDKAVEGAMLAKFRNTGQSCIAANRIYVQRSHLSRNSRSFRRKTQSA